MTALFKNCSSFNEDITSWDVSNVAKMDDMFYGADIFSYKLDNWNMNNVKTKKNMMNPKPKPIIVNQNTHNEVHNNGMLIFTNKKNIKLQHIQRQIPKKPRNIVNL